MNSDKEKNWDSHRSFLLMSELEKGENLSQREMAKRLGIALGLVNSYLKNLVAKGFVRVKAFPKNRYAYLLTPKGMAEKSRLAYQHLSYFNNLYRIARQDFRELFQAIHQQGGTEVSFCGVDEVAEIAYLSLKEVGIGLASVMDDRNVGQDLFGHSVINIPEKLEDGWRPIVITSLKRQDDLRRELLDRGADAGSLYSVG